MPVGESRGCGLAEVPGEAAALTGSGWFVSSSVGFQRKSYSTASEIGLGGSGPVEWESPSLSSSARKTAAERRVWGAK